MRASRKTVMLTPRNDRMFSWDSLLHTGTRFHKICNFRQRADLQWWLHAYLLRLFQILGGIYAKGSDGYLSPVVISSPGVREPSRRYGNGAMFLEPRREHG